MNPIASGIHACGLSRTNAMSGTAGAYSPFRAAAVLLLSFCIASCVSLYTEEDIPTLQTTGEPEWSEGLPVPPSGEVSFSFKPTQSSQFIHLDLNASHSLRQVQVVDQNNRVILETNFMPSAPSSAQARGGEAVRANTVSSSIVHSIPITGLDARMTYSVRVLLQMTDDGESGESGTIRAAISDELKPPDTIPVDDPKSGDAESGEKSESGDTESGDTESGEKSESGDPESSAPESGAPESSASESSAPDPGSSKENAILLAEDVPVTYTLRAGEEEKWFQFIATASTQYIYTPGTRMHVQVYAHDERPLQNESTTFGEVWYSSAFTKGNTYYISVKSMDTISDGAAYRILFTGTDPNPSDPDPGAKPDPGTGFAEPGLYDGNGKRISSIDPANINIVTLVETISSAPGSYTLALDKPLSVRGYLNIPQGSALTIEHTAAATGALFAVSADFGLTLGDNVTLQGKSGNIEALVQVNGGAFTMIGGTITGNENGGGFGGAVYVSSGPDMKSGIFNMTGGTISGNTALDGGGVYINGGTVILDGGNIIGNTATSGGGGVYINHDFTGGDAPGTLIIKSGKISNNENKSAYQGGGGIIMMSGSIVTMEGGEISGNEAAENGGGVYVWGGEFTIKGGTIAGNKAKDGAGVYVGGGAFNNEGGSIFDGIANSTDPGSTDPGSTDPGSSAPVPTIEMVLIPAGTFTMGSPANEPGNYGDETQHEVTLTKSFYIGQYEVTQEQYAAVMGANPSYFQGLESPDRGEVQTRRPVEMVTWFDAIVFCNRLSLLAGLTPVYSIGGKTDPAEWGEVPASAGHANYAAWVAASMNSSANGYRLPTEAEWEYACRAGTTTAFNCGTATPDSEAGYDALAAALGWYGYSGGNANMKTHEVGRKAPNVWGLYDMHGNVYEWVWDLHDVYTSTAVTDPAGPASVPGMYSRMHRGGSWGNGAVWSLRSAYRDSDVPTVRRNDIGFRLVRSAP